MFTVVLNGWHNIRPSLKINAVWFGILSSKAIHNISAIHMHTRTSERILHHLPVLLILYDCAARKWMCEESDAGIVVVLCWADTEQMGLSVWEPKTLLHCLSFKGWPVMQASTEIWTLCGWFLPYSTFKSSLKVAYLKNLRKKFFNNVH